MNAASISYGDLAITGLLVVLNAALSLLLNLGLARTVLVAGVRVVAQLLLVGRVLMTVFALDSPLLVAAVVPAMFAAASY